MAIRFVPRPEEEVSLERKVITFLVISIFIIIGSLFFLFLYESKKIGDEIGEIEKKISREKTPQELADENFVLLYKKKIDDYSFLLENHLFPSRLFELLEKDIDPQVVLDSFQFNRNSFLVTVAGQANDFLSLQRQYQNFEKEKFLYNITFQKTGYTFSKEGKRKVAFETTFRVDKSFLEK